MKPNDGTERWEDPIVGEVRAARARLFAEAGGDLDTLFASLTASQDARGGRQVLPRRRPQGGTPTRRRVHPAFSRAT